MEFKEYTELLNDVAIYPHSGTGQVAAIVYCALGLGEAGEIQGKVKKILRDDNGNLTEEKRAAILDECGDVLWYLTRLSQELGSSLIEVMEMNAAKLSGRKERGTLQGSGDNR